MLLKNKSSLLKTRKNENFQYLCVTTGEKNPYKNLLFFKQFEESLIIVLDRLEKILALVVKENDCF